MNRQQQQLLLSITRILLGNKYGLITLLVLGLAYYAFETVQREHASYAGVPQEQSLSLNTFTRIFRNEGFMVGYSEWRENPLWVTYHLTPIPDNKKLPRPSHFTTDNRSLARVSHDDYRNSGYDRGHMAPNYAISHLYGKEGQRDTFLMTNITPQKPRLNQKIWQRLEDVEANKFAAWFKNIWVITGPIFDQHITRLKSGVEIPDAFFKIYLVPAKDSTHPPKVLSFIIPQKVRGNESLKKFVTSINHIEELTGFDFFPKLDDAIEHQVESSTSSRGWRLSQVANLPARY